MGGNSQGGAHFTTLNCFVPNEQSPLLPRPSDLCKKTTTLWPWK